MSMEKFSNTLTDLINTMAKHKYSKIMAETVFSLIFLIQREKRQIITEKFLEAAS